MRKASKAGDRIYTPEWAALDMVNYFKPTGRILEPFHGAGVFTDLLPTAEWCEIENGRDFFKWTEQVDWIISNPPYSMVYTSFRHALSLANNLAFLVPLWKVFSVNGLLQEIHAYGGMVEIRVYGTGSKLGFPMGNSIGAIHCQRNHSGDMKWSYYGEKL